MKQLIQNFKSGEMYVDEIPAPGISNGMVLVENVFSLISSGTERGTVKMAQAGLLGKAKERPDLVAQVMQNLRKEGLSATINKVMTRLDTLKALGYSSAGTVVASMDNDGLFKPGDRVACAGQDYASHAAMVSVPQNLVARIPDKVSFEEAAFTTLGAIAMQGVRQAEPALGEKVCVIGLGLLGQITCQLLRAAGCTVAGIDLSENLVRLASKVSSAMTINRANPALEKICDDFTRGHGFDSVIITAATSSNDPVELAALLARKKGRIVIVGSVKMDIQREPYFYKKELDLRMSCSYGPGRYDTSYEEAGNDYPYPYVRWTEQRNMESFLELLSARAIDVKPLITHVFDISDAPFAYDIVLGKISEFHLGILLKYTNHNENRRTMFEIRNNPVSRINVGFIGAGNFAQNYLIPGVKAYGASLDGVVTTRGITSKNVADKFRFNFCSTSPDDILMNDKINTVFIATPHSSHAEFVVKALERGKNVFVEKPLALSRDQLDAVVDAKIRFPKPLMVGFNRRFAAVSERIKMEFTDIKEPLVINIRVNAGPIPKDHWIQDPEIGGGRIIGEVCHFIDLMQYFSGAEPVSVFAQAISTLNSRLTSFDNFAAIVKFSDGSVGNLAYLANGDNSLPKEKIEVFGGKKVGIINDFRDGLLISNGKTAKLRSSGKGHSEEIKRFLSSLQDEGETPISFRSICLTTLTTFRILDSLYTGLPQKITL